MLVMPSSIELASWLWLWMLLSSWCLASTDREERSFFIPPEEDLLFSFCLLFQLISSSSTLSTSFMFDSKTLCSFCLFFSTLLLPECCWQSAATLFPRWDVLLIFSAALGELFLPPFACC